MTFRLYSESHSIGDISLPEKALDAIWQIKEPYRWRGWLVEFI